MTTWKRLFDFNVKDQEEGFKIGGDSRNWLTVGIVDELKIER